MDGGAARGAGWVPDAILVGWPCLALVWCCCSPELEDPSAMFKLRRGTEKTDRWEGGREGVNTQADGG